MQSGLMNLLFWIGVVEQSEDLTDGGRVKVRVFGVHDAETDRVDHTDLPWAPVVDGTMGTATSIPQEGEWVFGAFMDGRDGQHPIVLGLLPGYHTQMGPQSNGGSYAQNNASTVQKFGKSALHSSLIGEGIQSLSGPLIASATNDQLILDSVTPTPRVFSEPKYQIPIERSNSTVASKDGQNYMVFTNDDTGVIQVTHQSGSVVQIDKEGTIFIKGQKGMTQSIHGSRIDYTEGSQIQSIENGDYMLRVTGPGGGNAKLYIRGDLDVEAENMTFTSRGDTNFNTKGSFNIRGADVKIFSYVDNVNIVAQQEFKTQSILGSTSLKSFVNLYTESLLNTVQVAGLDFQQTATFGDMELFALTDLTLQSSTTGIDMVSPIDISMNATLINIGAATTTNIDTFVRMATGQALGTTIPIIPAITATLRGITAAAPDMPDITDSFPVGGYKGERFPYVSFPSGNSSFPGQTGGQDLTSLGSIQQGVENILNITNQLVS